MLLLIVCSVVLGSVGIVGMAVVESVRLVNNIVVVISGLLLVVGERVGEGRKRRQAWAISCRPGPLVIDRLGEMADDWLALVGDGLR